MMGTYHVMCAYKPHYRYEAYSATVSIRETKDCNWEWTFNESYGFIVLADLCGAYVSLNQVHEWQVSITLSTLVPVQCLTCEPVPTNKDGLKVIISKHLQYMNSRNIRVPAVMEQLPNMYWLPKLHKVPYGSRFIAASNSCTTKPLSQLLTSCLSMILTHFKEYWMAYLKILELIVFG